MQVLNVAMGGTLVQDIPSQVPGALQHAVPEPRFRDRARGVGGEGLAAVDAARRAHGRRRDLPRQQPPSPGGQQAAPGLGRHGDLARRRHRSDGEARRRRSASRVQWHPENFWRTGEFRSLFEGFVAGRERAKAMTVSTCAVFGNRSNARTLAISIAGIDQQPRIARQRRDITRHIDQPRRAAPQSTPASASFDMPVRGGSTMTVAGARLRVLQVALDRVRFAPYDRRAARHSPQIAPPRSDRLRSP